MSGNLVNQPRLADNASARRNAKEPPPAGRLSGAAGRLYGSSASAMGAALAHELNQPLAALMIYLQSVQRQFEKNPELFGDVALDMLKKAIGEAERSKDIVRRMRRSSALDGPERSPVDLNTLADESIELCLVGLHSAPSIERHYHQQLPLISGDPVQVRQIMVNLICNAIDAVVDAPAPCIRIATRAQDGFVHFNISDNGEGIDKRIASKLFKAFETSKPHGMGLGLAISRMIAQNSGGDLLLQPGGETKGACFDLRLPISHVV